MFSDCKTITELNKKRTELLTEKKFTVLEINNAYNAQRSLISSVTKTSSKLQKFIPVTKTFPRVYTIPVVHGDRKNVIQLTEHGFVV